MRAAYKSIGRQTITVACRSFAVFSRDGVATVALHADALPALEGAATDSHGHCLDVAPPIGVTTTFTTSEGGPVYARDSNPTRERAEAVLAAIEGASVAAAKRAPPAAGALPPRCLLYASGAAATHAALHHLLAPGGPGEPARRLRVSGGYHGTHAVAAQMRLARPELEVAELPCEDALRAWLRSDAAGAAPDRAGAPVRPGDVLWLETPKNPSCEVADVALYVAAARRAGGAGSGCAVAVDSTFAPPPAQSGLLELGTHHL